MAEDDSLSAALAEIREREAKASRGPWKVTREHGYDMDDAPWSLPSVTGPDGGEIFTGSVDQPGHDLRFAAHAREDIPRLLKALEAALGFHQPVQLHGIVEDSRGNVTCGHGPDYDGDAHYEGDDGLWYCESLPGPVACSGCPGSPDGEYADWPCPEYEAILAALTGKGAPDA